MTDACEIFGFEKIITAMTGCAATQLTTEKIIATTLHHALGIYGSGEKLKKLAYKMKKTKLKLLRNRFTGVMVLVCDEVSMMDTTFLCVFNEVIKQIMKEIKPDCTDLPYGGLSQVWAGDFKQKKPVVGKDLVLLVCYYLKQNMHVARDKKINFATCLNIRLLRLALVSLRQILTNTQYRICSTLTLTVTSTYHITSKPVTSYNNS